MMTLVMAVSDHEAAGPGGGGGGAGPQHLLAAANARFGLDLSVARAKRAGGVALDEAQFDYLLALLQGDPAKVEAALAKEGAAGGSGAAGSSAGAGAGAGPSGGASVASLIQQIRDVLPDHGDGFLTACLWHYDMKAERVCVCVQGVCVCVCAYVCMCRGVSVEEIRVVTAPTTFLPCCHPLSCPSR
jgi:activating signal cointegrator complex subunit 2